MMLTYKNSGIPQLLGELFDLHPPYWPSLTRTDQLSSSSIVRLPTTPGTTPEATGLPAGFSDLHTVWHVVLEGAHGSSFVCSSDNLSRSVDALPYRRSMSSLCLVASETELRILCLFAAGSPGESKWWGSPPIAILGFR